MLNIFLPQPLFTLVVAICVLDNYRVCFFGFVFPSVCLQMCLLTFREVNLFVSTKVMENIPNSHYISPDISKVCIQFAWHSDGNIATVEQEIDRQIRRQKDTEMLTNWLFQWTV